jgi:hypothetical protein
MNQGSILFPGSIGTMVEFNHCQRGGIQTRLRKEIDMKRVIIAGVTALAVMASSQAFAQATTITLAPEQRTKIKEYVVKERVKPVTVKERITVGATLPADVELRAVPSDWGPSVSRYRYVYADDHVVFVDPSNRRVIQVLD